MPRLRPTAILWCVTLTPLAAQYYVASTAAGSGQLAPSAGGPALAARLVSARSVATAANGDVFFSDAYFNQVYRISTAGQVTLVAGAGRQGFSGDGGPAVAALLDNPLALTVDGAGNLLIADQGNGRIRRVTSAGVISTLASPGGIANLALNAAGVVHFTQSGGHTVRRLNADGTSTVIAGSTAGFSGDGGPASSATLNAPLGLRFDGEGNLYVADSQNHRIRRITPAGVISTVAGTGTAGLSGDGNLATAATLSLPADVATDAAGNVYIADASNGRVRVVNRQGVISTIAGGGASFADGPALQASLPGLSSMAFDAGGGLIVTVPAAKVIRRVFQQSISTVAGVTPPPSSGIAGPATAAVLLNPFATAADAAGNLYISDDVDHRVLRVTPAGELTGFAGNGFFGNAGNGGPATAAETGAPRGLAFDPAGNLLMTSGSGTALRRITPAGAITLVAGAGSGFAGDGGPASSARFLNPIGVAVDAAGNIFIADTGNHRIRRIDAATNVATTFAGTGTAGFAGDGGPADGAQFNAPRFLAFDRTGNLYVSDVANHRVRRIGTNRVITTVAGTDTAGFSGDGGPATAARLSSPTGIATDTDGNLYIATANRVRKVDAATQIITTIAGTGVAGFSGDGALATNATFDSISGLAVNNSGAVFAVDTRNYRIRRLSPVRIVPEGVANAASLRAGSVAPGLIVTIFGFDLGPAGGLGLRLDENGRVATELGGLRVFFDGIPAPILFASPNQVNVVAPYALAGPTTRIQAVYQNRPTNTISVPVVAASPGLFAITNQDGALNGASAPAAAGSILILYGTGEGQTAPAGVDGSVANSVFPKPVLDVGVTIGGRAAEILYAGAAPGFVAGVLQINVRVPAGLAGSQPLQVRVGEAVSPASTIAVR